MATKEYLFLKFLFKLLFFHRALTQLLTDLNLFVLNMDLTMTKQDVLSIQHENPDRERQKLIREQNIVKKVNYI